MKLHSLSSKNFMNKWTCLAMVGLLVMAEGCITVPRGKETDTVRIPPTRFGVRTSASGVAVAEVVHFPEMAYDRAEAYLKKKTHVTFGNRSLLRLEGNSNTSSYVVEFSKLTTYKTGITVTAYNAKKEIDPYAARELADGIVGALIPPEDEALPLKVGTVEPRSEK
jgi:hypothetical protein